MDISVHLRPASLGNLAFERKYVRIRSRTQRFKLQSLDINDGRCLLLPQDLGPGAPHFPIVMQHGDVLDMQINNDCEVMQVRLKTDQGSATYPLQ